MADVKGPVTILGGKYELIDVRKEGSLILNGNEVRWDYLNQEQANDLVLQGNPHIKTVRTKKAEEQKADDKKPETFSGSTEK